MRFLGFLAILAAIILGVGIWRGWFIVDVNKEKIEQDVETVKDAGQKVFKTSPKEAPAQPQ